MQITLIRHLPTEWNINTWLQGRQDIEILPITDCDQLEIVKNQNILSGLQPFDIILASKLKRTQQTAQMYGMNVVIEPLLDELDFGEFEGRPKEELLRELGKSWLENPRELQLGESVIHLSHAAPRNDRLQGVSGGRPGRAQFHRSRSTLTAATSG